jgi:hypothetical protein
MKHHVVQADDRQPRLFDDPAQPPPRRSDRDARDRLLTIVDTLAAAKVHPWSARLLGWQLKTFAALLPKLTPLDAAALQARLDAELGRLGPAED